MSKEDLDTWKSCRGLLHDALIKTSFTLSFEQRVLYPSVINDNNNTSECLRDLFQSFVHKIN